MTQRMRVIVCKHCGERWYPRRGTIYSWSREHAEKHNLGPEPVDMEEYYAWCRENFEGLLPPRVGRP